MTFQQALFAESEEANGEWRFRCPACRGWHTVEPPVSAETRSVYVSLPCNAYLAAAVEEPHAQSYITAGRYRCPACHQDHPAPELGTLAIRPCDGGRVRLFKPTTE